MSTSTILITIIVAALMAASFFAGMVAVRVKDVEEPIGDLKTVRDEYDGHVYFYMELDSSVVGAHPNDYILDRDVVKLKVVDTIRDN